jgi:YVTN family beta-propeller protein
MLTRKNFRSVLLMVTLLLACGHTIALADTVVATVSVPQEPVSVALSPLGDRAYVASNRSRVISIIDTATLTIINSTTLPLPPNGLALTPDGTQLWVALDTASGNRVLVFDPALQLMREIPVCRMPMNIAFRSNGGQGFVSCAFDGAVSIVQVSDGRVLNTVRVGDNPNGIAVASDPNTGANTVYVANTNSNSISYFRPSNPTAVGTIQGVPAPVGVATSPDGSQAYFTSLTGNSLSVVNVASNQIVRTIPTCVQPYGVAARLNANGGRRIYVACQGSNIVQKFQPNGTLLEVIPAGMRPRAIATALFSNPFVLGNILSSDVTVGRADDR